MNMTDEEIIAYWRGAYDRMAARSIEDGARIAALEEQVGRLEDENSDLRYEPWPEWARAVLKVIRKHSGYDGYDDATEGVDMPLELSEHLSEMEAEVGRWKARAEAAEALLKEVER